MTKDTSYNGWTNYETWNVNLWMDNDQGTQAHYTERAHEYYADADADDTFSKLENAALSFRDEIKNDHEESMPELSGTYADLLNGAMSEVNWYEIAKNWIENHIEEEN